MLREILARRGVDDVRVSSAGELEGGEPADEGTMWAAERLGVDLRGHRSRQVTADDVAGADVVLTMARRHLRHVAVLEPSAFGRSFTLKELARRGEVHGPRRPDETVAEWLERLGSGRRRADLVGASADDDIADPIGGTLQRHAATAEEMTGLLHRFASLAFPARAAGAAPPNDRSHTA